MIPLVCAVVFSFGFAGAAAFAAPPSLTEVRPWGAQRGQTFVLNLRGQNLEPGASVVSPLPATFTPLVSESKSANAMLSFLVELDAEARVGPYPLRVRSPEGISNILLFSVGVFPETMEEESELEATPSSNDSPGDSQPIPQLPATVNGKLQGRERDVYRFQAKKDQQLVLEVEARRVGSGLDPVLLLLDSEERELAFNDDANGLDVDSRLDVRFPSDGTYYVVVHDSRFSEQMQNHYRLKVGDFAYAEGLFPLGWRRGEKREVELIGGNLPHAIKVAVDLSEVGEDGTALVSPPGETASLPFRFAVGDLPEITEQSGQSPRPLKPSTVMNGRIAQPGEIDRYALEVRPGQDWTFEVTAGLLNSPLMALVTVYDGDNKMLASAGDDVPDAGDFSVIPRGFTSSDPYLALKVPENTYRIEIAIEDLVQRGGPLYGYRLVVKQQPPEFTIRQLDPYVNIPQGGSAAVRVIVDRRGYRGPVRLHVTGAENLKVDGGFIAADFRDIDAILRTPQGFLTVSAVEDSASVLTQLRIWGEGTLSDGQTVRIPVPGPGLITPVLGATGSNANRNTLDIQKPFEAPWLGLSLPAMVTKRAPAKLTVEGPQTVRMMRGMGREMKWALAGDDFRPPKNIGTQVPIAMELRVNRGKDKTFVKEGSVIVQTTVGTPVSKFDVLFFADVDTGKGKERIYARAVTFDIIEGYELEMLSEGLLLDRGNTGELLGKVLRDADFFQSVEIRVDDLPAGVSCETVAVAENAEQFRLVFQATDAALAGEHRIQLIASSTIVGYNKEKVPYRIPPVEATLVVPANAGAQPR